MSNSNDMKTLIAKESDINNVFYNYKHINLDKFRFLSSQLIQISYIDSSEYNYWSRGVYLIQTKHYKYKCMLSDIQMNSYVNSHNFYDDDGSYIEIIYEYLIELWLLNPIKQTTYIKF